MTAFGLPIASEWTLSQEEWEAAGERIAKSKADAATLAALLEREPLVQEVIRQYRRSLVRGECGALEDLDAAAKALSDWKAQP